MPATKVLNTKMLPGLMSRCMTACSCKYLSPWRARSASSHSWLTSTPAIATWPKAARHRRREAGKEEKKKERERCMATTRAPEGQGEGRRPRAGGVPAESGEGSGGQYLPTWGRRPAQ